MADPKAFLIQLNQNLNVLHEREAKHAGTPPLNLLNQIRDHQQAIALTEQRINGELSETEWKEKLKPLLLAINNGQVVNIESKNYVAGEMAGDIVEGHKILNEFELTGGNIQGLVQANYGTVTLHVYNLPNTPGHSIKPIDVTSTTPISDCPYRGLLTFRPEHARFFFGRQLFVNKLVQSTNRSQLVVVSGASGSGKSSVVFAGFLPTLNKLGRWNFTYFRPGSNPFQSISEALVPLYESNHTEQMIASRKLSTTLQARELPLSDVIKKIQRLQPDNHLLIVGDQFEELYTNCRETSIRQQFLEMFLETLNEVNNLQVHFVLTLRADFLGQASLYRPFADALQDNIELLGPMTRAELNEAIEKPAALQGVHFEEKLVDRLLNDVGEVEGGLPLLEFALTELWQQQQHRLLTHIAYSQIGEVKGALSRHADQVYQSLTSVEQNQARHILTQLVNPGVRAEDTRRLVARNELETDWPLVIKLANERLVVTNQDKNDQETAELVHEALIRGWQKLRQWLEEDREILRLRHRLSEAANEWQQNNQNNSYLYRGRLLAQVYAWTEGQTTSLTKLEKNFIQASINAEKSTRNQILIPFIILALILGGLGIFVVTQLVGGSFEARLKNQLLEAGRVVSDEVVNSERLRLEVERLVANTIGVPEALVDRNFTKLDQLIFPLTANSKSIDSIVIIDTQGKEVLRFQRETLAANAPVVTYQRTGASFFDWSVVNQVLSGATDGSKETQLARDPTSNELIIYTVGAIKSSDGIVGAVLVGTYLQKELATLHDLTLADVTLFDENAKVLITTLPLDPAEADEVFAIFTPERYQQVLAEHDVTLLDEIGGPQDIQTRSQTYRLAYAPYLLRGRVFGVYTVALPTNFVAETNNQSRNGLITIFFFGICAIFGIGYLISRRIIPPTKTRKVNSGPLQTLLVLSFSMFYLFFCAQVALVLINRENIEGSMLSDQRADYGRGPGIAVAPLSKDLIDEAIQDEAALGNSPLLRSSEQPLLPAIPPSRPTHPMPSRSP